MRLFSTHGAETTLVADIGGGGSAVGFLELSSGTPSRIVASARAFTPIEERTGDQSITQIAQSLAEAAAAAQKTYAAGHKKAPKEIIAVVHAPWASSQTAAAERSFDRETRITSALIGELAKEALAKADVARADMLEASVAHVELNGYPSRTPERFSAHHAKVVVLVSEMKAEYKSSLEHALQQAFPGIPVKFRSQARALASLMTQEGDSRNAVVIDVADDAASVTVIRKQAITEQARIPAGVHALLTKIAAAGSREETLALIGMLERGACQSAECDRIVKALAGAEPELTKLFGEAFTALAAKRRLPNDALLVTNADLSPWFAQFLSRIDFAQFTTTARPLAVHALVPEDLARYAKGEHVTDVSLLIAAALVHIEHGR